MKKITFILIFLIGISSVASYFYFKKNDNTSQKKTEVIKNKKPNVPSKNNNFNPTVIRVSFSSDFLFELRTIFDYAKYLEIFEKNWVYLEWWNYYESKNINNINKNKKADVEIKFWIISDFFNDYYSGKKVSWIANVTKWIQWYWVSAYSQNELSKITNIWIIPFSKDKEFIWTVLIKWFWINFDKKYNFIEAKYDKDKEEKLKSKEIDFTYFKWKKEILSKTYNIIEPVTNWNYYHYRVAYVNNRDYITKKEDVIKFKTVLKMVLDKIKNDEKWFYTFMDEQYKKGLIVKEIMNSKEWFYKDIKKSIEWLDYEPNIWEVNNVLEVFKQTNNQLKFDKDLKDSIK